MSQKYVPKALRELITNQAKSRCGYCLSQQVILGFPMEFDHLIPQSLGGLTTEDNLWLACSGCNDAKNNRLAVLDTESDQLVSLFNPRIQIWSEHFSWNEEGDTIIGLTAVGRATVAALRLNRPLLVNARNLWVSWGLHPPKD